MTCSTHVIVTPSLRPAAPTNPSWRRRTSPSSSTRSRGTPGSTRSCIHVWDRTRSRFWWINTNPSPLIQTEVRLIDGIFDACRLDEAFVILFWILECISLVYLQVWLPPRVSYSSWWGQRQLSSCRTSWPRIRTWPNPYRTTSSSPPTTRTSQVKYTTFV